MNLVIQKTANGYLVTELDLYLTGDNNLENALCFASLNELTNWIKSQEDTDDE